MEPVPQKTLTLFLFPTLFGISVIIQNVDSAAARCGIGGPSPRDGFFGPAINTTGRQTFAMDRLFEDARYLLREGAVLGSGTPLQRLLEVVGDVGANKNSFAICHLLSVSPSIIPIRT